MKVTYRGPCEELYGREIEVPDHNCVDHIRELQATHVETHGLDCGPYERWTDTWWECTVCFQSYDERDVSYMESERSA